jgi:hypothetical protein
MGEGLRAKDPSITSSELRLEGSHPKLARAAMEKW